jgi:RNA polymerase sigma-70 factor (ECF subfamily)
MSHGQKQPANERRQWVLAALDEYEGRLTRYALRLLGDLDLARDAVQHTFLKLCDDQVIGTLRVPLAADIRSADGTRSVPITNNRLAAWLFTVCRNRATDLLRSHARERQAENDRAEQPAGHETDPALAAEEADLADLLRRLIRRLPASQREAIDLWAEGFAYAEIARIVERHEGHVRVLVHRGLKALREHPQVREVLEVRSAGSAEPSAASGASHR